MATYQYGSRNNYSINGFNPPYKIGKSFTMPSVSAVYQAPDFTGTLAQPCLVSAVEIQVGGNTQTRTSKFGIWDSSGSNGTYSANVTLPIGGTNPAYTSASLSRIVFGQSTYIVGFTKPDQVSSWSWNADSSKSGYIIQDNNSASGSFTNSANYESGSLVFRLTYATLPIAPTGLTVTNPAGTTSAALSWTAPTDNGGSAITGYRVQRSTDNVTWTTVVSNTGSTSTSYTNTGLVNGTKYYFRVAALNAVATTAGTNYSSQYTASSNITIVAGGATDKTSTLTVSVANNNVSLLSFSDDGNGIPFSDIQIVYGGENLYNQVTATGTAGSVTINASQSQTDYGLRNIGIDGLVNRDVVGLQTVANENLWRYYLPVLRIQSVSVQLSTLTADQRSAVLGLELGSGITVSFTPNRSQVAGQPITAEGWVTGIALQVDLEQEVAVISITNTSNNIFTLDSDSLGFLDSNTLG